MKGIYKFQNKVNNKVYIGQSMNIEHRYKQHKRLYLNGNNKFYNALCKYGWDSFSFEIIDTDNKYTRDDLNKLEKYYIEKYNSFFDGYNSTFGGDTAQKIQNKLQYEEIIKIKELLQDMSLTQGDIAAQFNVSEGLVCNINLGKIWNNIGEYIYPIRKSINNVGGNNPNATLSNDDVMYLKQLFVNYDLNKVYEIMPYNISKSELKKILYSSQFKSLPIYRKRQKVWELNGTCIDYPGLQE